MSDVQHVAEVCAWNCAPVCSWRGSLSCSLAELAADEVHQAINQVRWVVEALDDAGCLSDCVICLLLLV